MKNNLVNAPGCRCLQEKTLWQRLMSKLAVFSLVVLIMLFGPEKAAKAAEGAASHYLTGLAGDILIAQSPKPGLQVGTTLWYQTGEVNTAVLEGKVRFSLNLDLFLALAAASYTFEKSVLGGTYTMAIGVPFGYANLDASLTGPLGNRLEASDNAFNLSDIAFTPLQLNWHAGSFSFKLAQIIIAPTGAYDTSNLANLGKNYWSSDTVGAVSWINKDTGTGVDIAPGIMANTENDKTNYKTGTEFHLDFNVNQFLSKNFVIGIRGYYYKQISGDSGDGAILGDFKGEAYGIGPGFVWIPTFAGGDLTVLGKWIHDLHTENRFDSDYFTFSVGWKF